MTPPFETSARIELRARASGLTSMFAGQPAQEVLHAAIREVFPGRIALVSSFGTEAAILLHMVAQIDPYTPVMFLETGKHFPETLQYRDTLVRELGLCNTHTVTPRPAILEADDPDGELHKRDTNLCCHVRKTLPMLAALRVYDCWITGRKRHQSSTRSELTLYEAEDCRIKVNPLVDWNPEMLREYFAKHDLPEHPLMARGYLSVGCAPCTKAVKPGEDPRAGRWADSDKTECGIHIVDGKLVRGKVD